MNTDGTERGPLTDAEVAWLLSCRLLARIATVGADGAPHVTPVGWSFNQTDHVFEIGGRDLATTKKFRDVARSHRAAIVIDEVLPPWRPRGLEVRGRAEVVTNPQPLIRLYPRRLIGWGIDAPPLAYNARDFRVAQDR
jgi:pyridoxamine 5'-phosphate oxidase family protein